MSSGGCSFKLLSLLYCSPLFLSLSPVRMVIHSHVHSHVCTSSIHTALTLFDIISYVTLLTFSTVADVLYPGVLCFFSALIASSKPFICQERFCLHLLSVLTQKNKLPLICQCSLICSHGVFFRTSLQVRLLRWVG